LLPEDIQRGHIDHVISVTFPQFRNQDAYFVQTDVVRTSDYYSPCIGGTIFSTSWRQHALGACQILRLKPEGQLVDVNNATIDESKLANITRIVLRGFREYGIMPARVGKSMSIIAESTITGNLSLAEEQVRDLIGRRAFFPEFSAWYQVLAVLGEELAQIPLASAAEDTDFYSFLTPDRLRVQTPNWEVVVGGIGESFVGESFIYGYNYYGSKMSKTFFLSSKIFFFLFLFLSS
jgi:hypothetical protein